LKWFTTFALHQKYNTKDVELRQACFNQEDEAHFGEKEEEKEYVK
jgi:hypothetical protein